MALIELTKGFSATVDEVDAEWLSQWKWHAGLVSHRTPYVRARRSVYVNGKKAGVVAMHNEIWTRHNGSIPDGYTVDHIEHGDFGALDNRLGNLRLASPQHQQFNHRKKAGTSRKYKGVSWHKHKHKWLAHIAINQKNKYLGSFESEIEAARAYDAAAIVRDPQRYRLNFPNQSNN